MNDLHIIDVLKNNPLFALMEENARLALARRMSVHSYEFGETVFSRGDVGGAIYFVVMGKARLAGTDATGHEVSLDKLETGQHFGEAELLHDGLRSYTVRAAESLVVLKLSAEDFNAWIAEYPDVESALRKSLADNGILDFLKQFTVMGAVPAYVLRALISELDELQVEPGCQIIREGDAGDRFYIVRKGILDVTRQVDGQSKVLGQLVEGEFFGERALLTNAVRAATVQAKTSCDLYALSRQGFERALSAAPQLRARLQARMDSYHDTIQTSVGEIEAPVGEFLAAAETDEDADTCEYPRRPRWWRRYLRALPYVKQHDETDCGAACLTMIMRYYHVPSSVSQMRDLANVDADGASMWSLAQAAEGLGLHARGLLLSMAALRNITLPAIVHWEGNHYIVLYAVGRHTVTVGDPALSLKTMSIREFREGWTGRALELTPTARLGADEKRMPPQKRFRAMIKPQMPLLMETLLASLLLSLFGLGMPLFTQAVVDRVLINGSVNLLNMLLMGMVLVTVLQGATSLLRSLMLAHISSRADARLITEFLKHVFHLPMSFFNLRRVGDIVSRVSENDKVRDALVGTIPGVVIDSILTLGYLALMMAYNAQLTLLAIVILPIFVLLIIGFTPAIRRNRTEQFSRHAKAWSYLIESITGIETVKACAAEMPVRWKMDSLFIHSLKALRSGTQIEAVYMGVATFLQSLSSVLFLWLGARLVISGTLTAGQMLAFCALAANVLAPVVRLVGAWSEMQDVRNAIARLNDVFHAREEERRGQARLQLNRMQGRIQFEAVTFAYNRSADQPVLSNINVEIHPGETIAIVGRSGSGKSTLGKLVLGMYAPRKGRILLDGHDLRTLSLHAVRRCVGVVPQDVFLFSGSVRENIALGDPDLPLERIISASRKAGAHEFVERLPLGYDTQVGERGMSLSGGQQQRLALARALVRDPDILILDEATSALDTETERAVQKRLEDADARVTTLVIAHRLSTVRTADRILVIDKGMLVESGNHTELMEKGGLYALLAGEQIAE